MICMFFYSLGPLSECVRSAQIIIDATNKNPIKGMPLTDYLYVNTTTTANITSI